MFPLFLGTCLIFVGSKISINEAAQSPRELITDSLEDRAQDLLDTIRKNNEEVLNLAEELLDATQVAQVLELSKDLSYNKKLGLKYYTSHIGLADTPVGSDYGRDKVG